jgi:protein-disulfide isomerase
LKRLGIENPYMFGSIALGDAGENPMSICFDLCRLEPNMNRRAFLDLSKSLAAAALVTAAAAPTHAADVDIDAILNDPEAPSEGNPKGDVTIVAFVDYNCPFCKQSAPDLDRIVRTDRHIRLVYKDWPILSEASVYGAQLALAAKYQGRYAAVHHALMSIRGTGIAKETMSAAVAASGVNMGRLQADLDTHGEAIAALLKRNLAEADALGLEGTPVYLVGPFKASTLDYDGFKQIVANARERQAGH